jgi:hypothetical protein
MDIPKRKPGRPPKDESILEGAHIDVRMPPELRRAIRVAAAQRDTSLGAWMKEAAMLRLVYDRAKAIGEEDLRQRECSYERAGDRWMAVREEIMSSLAPKMAARVVWQAFCEGYCSVLASIPSVYVPTETLHRSAGATA